jgi:hypothetical protein
MSVLAIQQQRRLIQQQRWFLIQWIALGLSSDNSAATAETIKTSSGSNQVSGDSGV